jgi:hypothetical protein
MSFDNIVPRLKNGAKSLHKIGWCNVALLWSHLLSHQQ